MTVIVLAFEVRQLKSRRRAALQELAREQARARSAT
jgi:heme exporter protein D